MSKSICVLARQVCPETNDPAKHAYCPLWRDHMPSVLLDGSYRLNAANPVRGCYLRLIDQYSVSAIAEADHAHAAANQARDVAVEAADRIETASGKIDVAAKQIGEFNLIPALLNSMSIGPIGAHLLTENEIPPHAKLIGDGSNGA